jgi:anthranilate synthase/aminodeoxychorismate synthase-like glutamine amidotransferase
MIALIDNYDSFTFNIYDYLARHREVRVFRNTESPDRLRELPLSGIVISPGPSHPAQSGLSLLVLDRFAGRLPILGICLGMQAIGLHFGCTVRQARSIMHGKVDAIEHFGGTLFVGIDQRFRAARYHSLVVECDGGPLKRCAVSESDGETMAVEHGEARIFGLQFHPESYATPDGMKFIKNFLEVCDGGH